MKKALLLILTLVLIAGVGYGSYWYGIEKSKKISSSSGISKSNTQEKCSSNQPANLCLPGESKISDDSAGLKTFRSDRYGIEFKYPSSYQISVSHSFIDPDVVILSSDFSDEYRRGSIKFSVKYNPTFADPLETIKQSIKDCEEVQKGVGVGVPCTVGIGNPDTWEKVIIDDKSYGYKTGIAGDPLLKVSFYAISSIAGPKGSTFVFDAFLPSFDTSNISIPIEQEAAQDPNVKNFLAIFDQIIKSTKFFSIFKN